MGGCDHLIEWVWSSSQLGGEELSSLADLHLVDKLLHFMKGGLKREGVSGGVASSAMPCHLVMVSIAYMP